MEQQKNSYIVYNANAQNATINGHVKKCQDEVHEWGRANQVAFDPAKEYSSIISSTNPEGQDFKILGIWFDTALSMKRVVSELCGKVSWELTSLFRASKLFDIPGLVIQYKARILQYIEYRSPAIYHADATVLAEIDHQYCKFLRGIGITSEAALEDYSLAPLKCLRAIAMLGVRHRAVIGKGLNRYEDFSLESLNRFMEMVEIHCAGTRYNIERSVKDTSYRL